jgi:hypothetical protein
MVAEMLQPQACQDDFRLARLTLQEMVGVDVDGSLAWFTAQGGYCDCEVGLNVLAPWMSTRFNTEAWRT